MENNRNGRLPAIIDNTRNDVAPLMPPVARTTYIEAEPATTRVPLSHYLWVLRRHGWRMALFVMGCVLAAIFVSLRLTPIYEATATVDIDRQTPTRVIGQDTAASSLNDADQFLSTQVRLIQSDSVLRPVVEKFPAIEDEEAALSKRKLHSAETEDAPVIFQNLKVARPPNTYLLLLSYRSRDPELAADVANAVARSYIEHTYDLRFRASVGLTTFMDKQLEDLRAKMERSTSALAQFERELKVINPEEKTSILSSRLLQLNTEFTDAQADRVRKEAAVRSMDSAELEAAQVSTQGESLDRLAEKIDAARERFAQVQTQYGANHPQYRKVQTQLAELERQMEANKKKTIRRVEVEFEEARNREDMLRQAVTATKEEFDELNARSFEYQQVKREADADKKLYEELVWRVKEAGLNANFQNNFIRLADAARPPLDPVSPNIRLNALLAFLLSSIAAIGLALVSDVTDTTLRDPEDVRRLFDIDVIGNLPVVKARKSQSRAMPVNGKTLTAGAEPGSLLAAAYDEAIRTLRNSILLTDFDRSIRSLLITSAQPGEGKSTTGISLAIVHAQQGKRTLVIDGDLRRPSLHRIMKLPGTTGLSNALAGELGWRDAVIKVEAVPGLHILVAGPPTRQASDLVGRGLVELIGEAAEEYDLVVLDAPPLLGFAEPLQMATAVDGVLVVTQAGRTDRGSVGAVVTTLRRLRANILGIVLNQVHKDLSNRYYYGRKYYKYYQTPKQDREKDSEKDSEKDREEETLSIV